VVNAAELEAFVDQLVAGTARRSGRRLDASARSALVADLRKTAERTLPALSVALGDRTVPPALVATQAASRTFGVELEGMSPEDRDFEIARQLVRLAQSETARVLGP
jgi:hypothetical protein